MSSSAVDDLAHRRACLARGHETCFRVDIRFVRCSRVVFVVFMIVIAALGAGAYLYLFLSHVPGAKEERLGRLEALPPNLGKWIADQEPGPDGLLREQRHLFEEPSGFGSGRLLMQVRYRDPTTREIVRIEPERRLERRRVRSQKR